MTSARAWPVRAMYILLAAALAIGLFLTAAPANQVSAAPDDPTAEWSTVDTPTMAGWVLAPESTIYDYALASDGDVAYAVVWAYDEDGNNGTYRLLMSDTAGATWSDLTDTLETQVEDDGYGQIDQVLQVATDWVDPDFIAVALVADTGWTYTSVVVYVSNDGGDTFVDAGEVEDSGVWLDSAAPHYGVSDLAVSYAVDGKRDVAIGGRAVGGSYPAGIFRCTVTDDSPGAWTDAATSYAGWDDGGLPYGPSFLVTDIIFSYNWPTDATILVTTVAPDSSFDTVYLQSGTWGKTTGAWNANAGFADAVPVETDVPLPPYLETMDARAIAGVAIPSDYDGSDSLARYSWVWVNYYDFPTPTPIGEIVMVNDSVATPINQQIAGHPWLTNVSYYGTIAEGKAIAGLLGDGDEGYVIGCEGIQVYHNNTVAHMNICCEPWELACKLPTGEAAMAVSYVTQDKAYAVALQSNGAYDESAWSVSVDGDGLVWNQLSLVDTYISYISDVAVSPDCNKMFLATVNDYEGARYQCDSVWLKATDLPEDEEYSGYWIRTWCGELMGDNSDDFPWYTQRSLLRLSPDETTGDTVYLVDRMTNTIYYNDLETWNCWKTGTAPMDDIVDLAVMDEATIYALGADGQVAMSDDHGKAITWTDPVDSKVSYGWTIAVHGDYVLVGGMDGDASYSDDSGDTFTALDDVYSASDVHVTVAFDTYFDTNDVVYAALANAGAGNNGIFMTTLPDNTEWTDLGADPDFNYTGLVLSYASGNPFTSADTGGVLYASYFTWIDNDGYDSGVARSLTPIVEEEACQACPTEWDYLTYGLDYDTDFTMPPFALKACGCLTTDTNTKLFAIDDNDYGWEGMVNGEPGTVWTFEDCYAKKAVELTSPADGFVVGTSSCDCCNVPFNIFWDRLCDACGYEIEFALDPDFTQLVPVYFDDMVLFDSVVEDGAGNIYFPESGTNPSAFLECYFQPETTYYWRVRAAEAGTGQIIHSWWSDAQSFTVAPTAASGAIELVAPTPGATDVPVTNAAFSWHMLASWDSFDFVLSKNADLSSPVMSSTGLHSTAASYTGTLSYDTPYYWQVTAYKEGSAISMSAIGTFRTMEQPAGPVTPEPTPTPFWVWVVIAIGAVLVIVVIVLIFRTRRV
jgi:hypothetical protein